MDVRRGVHSTALAVMLGVCAGARAQECGFSLAGPDNFDTGGHPEGIAVGDVNGDTVPDLAVTGRAGGTVSILLGVGDGTYHPQALYAVGDSPIGVALADFNHDGRLDVVTANHGGASITVRLGVGNGVLGSAITTVVGTQPIALVAGDFNTDGFADVAVLHDSSARLWVLIGKGTGAFNDPAVFMPAVSSVSTLIGVDLNLDGLTDLVASGGGGFRAYVGASDGTFTQAGSAVVSCASMSAGDFDNDGWPDILAGGQTSAKIVRGLGDGQFASPALPVGGDGAWPAIAADFDGDGNVDAAVCRTSGLPRPVEIRRGNGDGTFTTGASIFLDGNSFALIPSDVNQDGKADVVACIQPLNYCSVYLNTAVFPARILAPPAPVRSHLQPVTLSVDAAGDGITYRWERDGVPLDDGGNISGAFAPQLTIDPCGPADEGDYSVVISNDCASVESDPAHVDVYCPADFDENDFVNGDDFDAFAFFFYWGDIEADFDGNTFVNGDDFDLFTLYFEGGC